MTRGSPTCRWWPAALDEREVLRLAAGAESGSEHPLGAAVVRHAREMLDLEPPAADGFEAWPGRGVSAAVDGHAVLVGRPDWLAAQGVAVDVLDAETTRLTTSGRTAVHVAIDGRAVAVMGIADTLRPSAVAAIARLRTMGIEPVMLTGDQAATARAIAQQAGISRFLADVLPDEKAAQVRRLQGSQGPVAMVGDGVNDAPALAAADVGIAMGGGSDVAVESASVTLTGTDLWSLVGAVDLSRATMRNIRQNLFWAFAYNAALIPHRRGGALPVHGDAARPDAGSARDGPVERHRRGQRPAAPGLARADRARHDRRTRHGRGRACAQPSMTAPSAAISAIARSPSPGWRSTARMRSRATTVA